MQLLRDNLTLWTSDENGDLDRKEGSENRAEAPAAAAPVEAGATQASGENQ